MNLSGNELKKLVNAIVSAYPTRDQLALMVEFELEKNLDAIAEGDNQTIRVFNLVTKWAKPRGQLYRLIMAAYNANSENPDLKQFYESVVLKNRYLVDITPNKPEFGPDIHWQGETDEIQLQSWLKPEPDYWDVGFLKRSIEQSAAVCRIEIPTRQIMGTGVLITQNCLLTNYHVLHTESDDELRKNALNAVLKFGCFSSDKGIEDSGQVLRLDRDNPIICASETDKLDFVLLRVEDKITQLTEIKPARWKAQGLPREKQGINVLQHPEGDSMKLSISQDGVTGVDQERGLVQYVNKTACGSSGSPCFDEDWYLVALHHAQRAKTFGTIREGILWSSIYQEIKGFLD